MMGFPGPKGAAVSVNGSCGGLLERVLLLHRDSHPPATATTQDGGCGWAPAEQAPKDGWLRGSVPFEDRPLRL